jgi:hypothetical protein
MYGSDEDFSHNEILQKVLDDLQEEELKAYRSGSDAIVGIKIAQAIVQKHIDKGYV